VPSSYLDLADPSHLVFEYMQQMAEVIDRVGPAGGPLDVMGRMLGERMPIPLPPQACNDFAELSRYMIGRVASVTAYLARMVPGPDSQAGLVWFEAVMSQLDPAGEVPPCKAPDGDGLAHALDEVQTLPMMLRPVLMRGWVDAALATSGRARLYPMASDALRMVACLLDSPMPPDLARHFAEVDWSPPP